jgi:hypothetical protein
MMITSTPTLEPTTPRAKRRKCLANTKIQISRSVFFYGQNFRNFALLCLEAGNTHIDKRSFGHITTESNLIVGGLVPEHWQTSGLWLVVPFGKSSRTPVTPPYNLLSAWILQFTTLQRSISDVNNYIIPCEPGGWCAA